MSTCHAYPTLYDAALAALRIYGPLATNHVQGKLNTWRKDRMLAFPYNKEYVPGILDRLQTEGKIEYSCGLWRTM